MGANWRKNNARLYADYIRTSVVGLEIGLSIGLASVLGFFLDKYLKTSPWMLVFGFTIGTLAAGRRLYLFIVKYLKENS